MVPSFDPGYTPLQICSHGSVVTSEVCHWALCTSLLSTPLDGSSLGVHPIPLQEFLVYVSSFGSLYSEECHYQL